DFVLDVSDVLQAIAEGLPLAEFDPASYKTRPEAPARASVWIVSVPGAEVGPRLHGAVARGRLLGECSNLSRELCNEPGNTLPPREFARRAAEIASGGGASVEILT